ncbi:type II secretion system protein N [Hyphococcus sp.]|uniref:type II secretion system protein N n=1 Tax=Hyphococcus sp. TaxID=2038636 RepID=UPI0020893BDF|nr:MAG: type II secretion system protein N [Marinicaulis sp.]
MILGALVFCATMLANAPASLIGLASGQGSPSYSNAEGTLWRGALRDVSVSGVALGDISFRLSPWSVLQLSPRLDVSSSGGAVTGRGSVTLGSGKSFLLKDVEADISLRAIAPRGVFGRPAIGRAKINIKRLAFSRHTGCKAASGEVWTNVLDAPAQQFNLPALPMSGTVQCEGEALVVALEGENARTGAAISLKIDKSLTYEIVATARTREEDVASALRVFGFEDDNGDLIYGSVGVLTGAGS